MKPLILGTQSPRRKEILSFFSLPFTQIPSDFDEATISFEGSPSHYALQLAENKAAALNARFPSDLILTADTVVYFKDQVFNKPQDAQDAFSMLKTLSGQWHSVFTAVALQQGEQLFSTYEETKILFHSLSNEQIELYHQSCHFLDKAGSYAIQKAGSLIISKIDGCYYNVMGLPINAVRKLLLNMEIDLWKHITPF